MVVGGTSDGYGALFLGQLHQVIGLEEGRWRFGPPVVKTEFSQRCLRCPRRVLGDVVEVRVVLGEIAGRIAQVPEEVGTGVVAPEAPDVSFGMALNKGRCTSPDLVDVVNLPRTVVQEGGRSFEDKQIVVIGGASQECTDVSDVVADLEPDVSSEEVIGDTEIRGRKDDMPKLSRANSLITQDARGTLIHSLG